MIQRNDDKGVGNCPAVLWICSGAVLLLACSGDEPIAPPVPAVPVATTVTVTPSLASLSSLGETVQLAASVLDQNGNAMTGITVTWSSTAAGVATVSSTGLVTSTGDGEATITATAGSASGEALVRVELPPGEEREALVALYGATDGGNWSINVNWLSQRPLSEWYGVETDDHGRVTVLKLPENGLAGTIPPEIASLAHLEKLNLRKNNLTGALPPEIGNLTQLREIDLGHAALTGEIPATLGKLVRLRRLNLEYVPFTGSIPPELGALGELEFLNFFRNRLSGGLPAALGGLRSLQTVFFDGNALTGSVPPTFVQLEKLETFYWGDNDGLCAPATAAFEAWRGARAGDFQGPRCNDADLAALESLYKAAGGANWTQWDGWLDGAAVGEWYGVEADLLGRVTLLDLSGNGLRGTLPPLLGALDRLSVLRVGDNALSGRMPSLLKNLSLEEFRYAGTELCVPRAQDFRRWLASIPVREGSQEECPPLSDREILEVLYEATGGADWTHRDGWLTEAPLGDWHGVKADGEGRVLELALYGNNLRGRIPPESAPPGGCRTA
ncbi:MAG: Ig-like domain-containing protein [Gemmatimonadota bacterium]|nr:Ig-like domain-containing protein [Gemmatimonadota bacterium]MDE2865303.1 Ig-like domain-containing protein [Gemmatimonadota bacterium]